MSYESLERSQTDDIVKRDVLDRVAKCDSILDYIGKLYDRYNTNEKGNGYSRILVLAMVGSLFEEDRPGLGVDPNLPSQTAFMMGSFVALDALSQMIAMEASDEEKVLDEWMNSPTFFGYDGEDSGRSATQEEMSQVATAVSKERLHELGEGMTRLLIAVTDKSTDEGIIAVDQIPAFNYGFSFVLGGGRCTLELHSLRKYPEQDMSDELEAWLAS